MQIDGVDLKTANAVHYVLSGKICPTEASPACKRWVESCYHTPDLDGHEAKLEACNELLGMHGVEAIQSEDAPHYTDEGVRMCPPFSYCNTGDTYALTLIRDHSAGQWMVASWGDAFEEYEAEHGT